MEIEATVAASIKYYSAFNLTVASALAIPEFIAIKPSSSAPDLTIHFGEVAKQGLAQPLQVGAFFHSNHQQFWLDIPKVARFLVQHGNQIIIHPYPEADERITRVFLLDSCMKALLHQQHYFVLEGIAVEVNSRAVVFVMPSSYGKSTLAAIFSEHGYNILTDEICAISVNMQILPASPMIYLWENIIKQLNIDTQFLKTVRSDINKYLFTVKFQDKPLPIHYIYFVDYHKQNHLIFETINQSEKINIVNNELPGPSYLKKMSHIKKYQASFANIPMVKMICPRKHYTMKQMGYVLQEIFTEIEKDILERMKNHVST